MLLTVVGASGYRGNISDATYAGTDWGTSSDDCVRFTDIAGREVWLNYAHIASLNFKPGVLPPPGSYAVFRVYAGTDTGRGACDCLVDETQKDLILAQLAEDSQDKIVTFTTIYGVEVRLFTARIATLRITEESLTISP